MKKFRILLGITALFICIMGFSTMAYALEKPGKVENVKQVDASSSSVKIQWDAQVTQNCYYTVELSTDGVNFSSQTDYRLSSAYYTVTGLSAGKTYYVRIIAYAYSYSDGTLQADAYSDVLKVVTVPTTNSGTITQTAATTNSITLTWTGVSGATKYYVYAYKSGVYTKLAAATTNKAVIKNVDKSLEYDYKIFPVRSDGSFEAMSDYATYSLYSWNVRLVPTKITGLNVSYYYSALKAIDLNWNAQSNGDGYQIQVYNYNGKKPIKTYTVTSKYSSSQYLKNIVNNKFYKVRIRGYAVVNGSKKYGAWSAYKYVAQQTDIYKINRVGSQKKVSLKWDTVKGATNYTIYMSTKQKSGYKKVTTTKKTSLAVSKFNKKALKLNKKYYFYVVANKKVGKTTYKSGATYCNYIILK